MKQLNSTLSSSSTSVALAFTAATVMGCTIYLSFQQQQQQNHKKPPPTNDVRKPPSSPTATATDELTSSITQASSERTTTVSPPPTPLHLNGSIPMEISLSETTRISALRRIQTPGTVTIAYASTTGTCKSFAESLHAAVSTIIESHGGRTAGDKRTVVQICTVDELDWWDEITNNETSSAGGGGSAPPEPHAGHAHSHSPLPPPIVVFVLPTWTDGTLPAKYAPLITSLDEISHDWRVAPKPLRSSAQSARRHRNDTTTVQVGSFGMGSSAYDNATFCKPAKDAFKYMMKLGARSLLVSNGKSVVGTGDDDAGDCKGNFRDWEKRVLLRVQDMYGHKGNKDKQPRPQKPSEGCCSEEGGQAGAAGGGGGQCGCTEEKTTDSPSCDDDKSTEAQGGTTGLQTLLEEDDEDDYETSDDESEGSAEEPELIDVEDIGNAMQTSAKERTSREPKEMVTPKQAKALKKEGYKIIGTHSAVKLCRWTKHQLRGRGGCYKHTFYGITSYQCMETTPSLACANKCVFCWRHHKNPVGREWRWKTDDPFMIVDEAVKIHVSMIKEARGIPGVKLDRWNEAHTVKHCALSLVGEPIMYPRINELLGDLHARDISTFLVTNGQHPQAIEDLIPITQLYVSVDASTPESLDAIDRPLFKDAWDRLRASLKCLKKKGQRTVARLTVVKGWNSDEVEGYAKLIALGHCSIVEVKGVTFCGKSDASNLNMSNSPWHHEVVSLTQNLGKALAKLRVERLLASPSSEPIPEYDVACAHQHSCSVLLCRVDQFAVDDPVTGDRKWRTWIDYDKFQELARRKVEDPTFAYGVGDYVADTPDWALFGASEEGFDPTELRHRRKKKHPKYTKFDNVTGIPTHDDEGKPLGFEAREKLKLMMGEKKREIGDEASVVTTSGGEKNVFDASLMFRSMVVTK